MNCVIYDFETFSGVPTTGAAISMAVLKFDENRYKSNPYTYEELLEQTDYIKFDVKEQVHKYKRIVDMETVKWWNSQGQSAKKLIKPSPEDKSIEDLWQFFVDYTKGMDIKKVYTRGNGFDPIIFESIVHSFGKGVPYPWWSIRDTRSMLDGLLWGSGVDNKFIPDGLKEKFVHHDPRHDIVMDVMRMQTVVGYL